MHDFISLWSSTLCILESASGAFEEDVCSSVTGYSILQTPARSSRNVVLFKSSVSSLIFSLVIIIIESSVLTSLTVVYLYFPLQFCQFLFCLFWGCLIGTCMIIIIIHF